MSREIEFRGKRLDNGEWVYGDLRHQPYFEGDEATYIMQPIGGSFTNFPIEPETVGQYTGHKDNTGTKSYTGDIAEDADGFRYVVVWLDDEALYRLQYQDSSMCMPLKWISNMTIIGKMSENPKLITVRNEGSGASSCPAK